jgi:hypothetical protein
MKLSITTLFLAAATVAFAQPGAGKYAPCFPFSSPTTTPYKSHLTRRQTPPDAAKAFSDIMARDTDFASGFNNILSAAAPTGLTRRNDCASNKLDPCLDD